MTINPRQLAIDAITLQFTNNIQLLNQILFQSLGQNTAGGDLAALQQFERGISFAVFAFQSGITAVYKLPENLFPEKEAIKNLLTK